MFDRLIPEPKDLLVVLVIFIVTGFVANKYFEPFGEAKTSFDIFLKYFISFAIFCLVYFGYTRYFKK